MLLDMRMHVHIIECWKLEGLNVGYVLSMYALNPSSAPSSLCVSGRLT